MNIKSHILFFTTILIASCNSNVRFTDYVDTHIGTGGHGHVFVGANVPFGFVQLGPTSVPQAWDWTSGYHISDSTVIGFSHTHLEGTGIGDLFDITVMPVTGKVIFARGEAVTEDMDAQAKENAMQSGLWSYADRSKEVSIPGYYSVPLTRYGIKAEMTASARVGFHKYTYSATESGAIVFDLENGGCWDKTTETNIEAISDNAIKGYRYSTGWAKNQKIFFYAEFSKPFTSFNVINKEVSDNIKMPLYARADFGKVGDGEKIMLKVAISPVSEDNAMENMKSEIPGWNFDKTANKAQKLWNKELSKIEIKTEDEDSKKIFYTALYHSMIHPALFNDANGDYRGSNDSTYRYDGFTNYTIFSLWDTYRAAMPLTTIIHPEKMSDIVNTMLHIYSQQGKLPVWHLMGNETDCMVGNPGAIVVADAIVKGVKGFDKEWAFNALKTSVMLDERGQDLRKKYGYIPSDLYNESIANDMEYAIADGAVANAAEYMGKTEDAEYFRARSHSYRNYLDELTLLARGRFADGSWRAPFNPIESNHRENDYCEGNAWQYTWLAPQDFEGLRDFYGSNLKMIDRLDTLFSTSSILEGENVSPDISGLIGQYVHGNEPSHHIIYFYTMAGAPWKAAEKVREVLKTMYSTKPDGLSGNEDEGQMSAWYILSALGFYQVEPASTRFWFGSPLFDSATIRTGKNKFIIKAIDNSPENIYISSVILNGKPYKKAYIDYNDIKKGGKLVFTMSNTPVKWY